jgi:3-dehydroquinate dehydratase/shikimate dehydrogenase
MEDTLEADLRVAHEYRGKADLLELRADFLKAAEAAVAFRFPSLCELPVILTVRRKRDGGRFAADEGDRVALMEKCLEGRFAYADLEDDLASHRLEIKSAAAGARIIRSFHDFNGVPEDLEDRLATMPRGSDEIPKAAVMPRSASDFQRLIAAFQRLRGRQKILLGMGDFGFPSRVLASRLGSFLCYSSRVEGGAAPGHVDPGTLEDVYRFHSIGEDTAVFGVIGNPVMHSLSPLIHNRGFAALGLDAVYVPFLVDDLGSFWRIAEALPVDGFSVTVPHKRAIMDGLSSRDALVDSVGACNTVIRERNAASSRPGLNAASSRLGWRGANTDVEGFLAPLRDAFGGSVPAGVGVTVLGAGGAARAVVHALRLQGARMLVLNRTRERARRLAVEFGTRHGGLDEEGMSMMREFSDLIVQATSVGLAAAAAADPLSDYRFSGREIVYDLVYESGGTRFLGRAREAGCRTIGGARMLLAQAFEQFRLFTGVEYPREPRGELEISMDGDHRNR